MAERKICCVVCPISCQITVIADGTNIESITGHQCKRGLEYAKDEYFAPKRTLTSSVIAIDYVTPVISVRSNVPIPKEKLMDCLEVMRDVKVEPPFVMGKVVIPNILDTDADIVLTNC